MAALGPVDQAEVAILAAFALYGVRASEWLDEAPARVVADLRQRVATGGASTRGRRTRSAGERPIVERSVPDRIRRRRLWLFWAEAWCQSEAIKQAFRQRVKEHHPMSAVQRKPFAG